MMNTAPLNANPSPLPDKGEPEDDDARLKEACRQFESILMNQMLSSMRSSGIKSDLLGEDHESEMFGSLLDQQYADTITQQQGLGLSDLLFQQLTGRASEEE